MESASMTRRRRTLGTALALLCVPVLVALGEAVAFQFQNRNNGSIVSAGERREYLLHVPESYDSSRPTPLVISMHGAGGWPRQQGEISGWDQLADEHGFIVAYPSAIGSRGTRAWRLTRPSGLANDVRFISDLIDRLEKTYNIDPTRIYANGLSAGGGMSFALSCTLWERIAAIGTVAAARVLSWGECADRRPVPVIAFHGTADSLIPYGGGTTWIGDSTFPDVEAWMANWARRNRCAPEAIESAVAVDVTRRDYEDCADDAAVVLVTLHGGGHTWPGGEPLPEWFLGPTARSIDATRLMWAFFQEHPKRSLGD
jgi:polyhydroxybutyrate depolymerase